MTSAFAANAHEQLVGDQVALDRLRDLRGWTLPAIQQLGIGRDGDRVLIPVTAADGELVGLLRYQPNPDKRDDGQPKTTATPGSKRELFPPPETIDPAATIWLVEGEPDSITAASLGFAGVGIPGSSGWQSEWAARFTGRDVVICTDCDGPGRSVAERAASDLVPEARSVRVLDLSPARDDGYDLSDFVIEANGNLDAARDLLTNAADVAPIFVPEQDRPPSPRLSVADWRKAVLDHLHGTEREVAWPIPFMRLNEAADGGIRPGEIWVIAGYTSHGKSIYVDMLADTVSDAVGRVHIYATEMTLVQRGLRLVARRTGIPFRNLRRREITDNQLDAAEAAVAKMSYGLTVVTDWTPAQVAADARANGTQVAIVDLLHGFHYSDERELSAHVDAFAKAASSDASGRSAGTAVVLVCHLNDAQMRDTRSPARPKPGMHSLKGASSIKQRADTVMFVWLQDDADGIPTTEGEVWIAKARNGSPAMQKVELDTTRLMFDERT